MHSILLADNRFQLRNLFPLTRSFGSNFTFPFKSQIISILSHARLLFAIAFVYAPLLTSTAHQMSCRYFHSLVKLGRNTFIRVKNGKTIPGFQLLPVSTHSAYTIPSGTIIFQKSIKCNLPPFELGMCP